LIWKLVINFLFPSHIRKNFNRHYTNSNQSARHEDGKVESIKRGPNSPFEFRYSWQTANGKVEHRFAPFYSRRIVERVQKWLNCVDIQGSMKYSTSFSATLNWTWYRYTCITSSMDESELCCNCEARFGHATNCGIHCSNGKRNLAFFHYGGIEKKWEHLFG